MFFKGSNKNIISGKSINGIACMVLDEGKKGRLVVTSLLFIIKLLHSFLIVELESKGYSL